MVFLYWPCLIFFSWKSFYTKLSTISTNKMFNQILYVFRSWIRQYWLWWHNMIMTRPEKMLDVHVFCWKVMSPTFAARCLLEKQITGSKKRASLSISEKLYWKCQRYQPVFRDMPLLVQWSLPLKIINTKTRHLDEKRFMLNWMWLWNVNQYIKCYYSSQASEMKFTAGPTVQ